MIWLRHELWDYDDGPAYRLADRNGTDETGTAPREGVLKQVFYAPSPAAARAQYQALRQMGPMVPSRTESDEPFTLAQLQAQLAQFPDDATLHGQPALHPDEDTSEAITAAAIEAETASGASQDPHPVSAVAPSDSGPVVETPPPASNVVPIRIGVSNEAVPAPAASVAGAHSREMEHQAASRALALARAGVEPDSHAAPDDEGVAPAQAPLSLVASHSTMTEDAAPASTPSGEAIVEPLVPEPVAVEKAVDHDPLGPITVVGPAAVRGRRRRRKSGFFGGLLRALLLLIVLGAVIVGVGIATGTWNAPTLLAQARALPDQIRELSIVKTLLP